MIFDLTSPTGEPSPELKQKVAAEPIPQIPPEIIDGMKMAFDEHRAMKREDSKGVRLAWSVWDGKDAVIYEKNLDNKEYYIIDKKPHGHFDDCIDRMSWLQMARYQVWFRLGIDGEEFQATQYGKAEDYKIVGEKDFRGHKRLLLENRKLSRQLYVGIDDHRLYGRVDLKVDRKSGEYWKTVSRIAGKEIQNYSQERRWSDRLSPAERVKNAARLNEELFSLAHPWVEHYLEDHQELAPGLWFPAKQGYAIFELKKGKPVETFSQEWQLVEAKANEPLDDKVFMIELKDGVDVTDLHYDPPLRYEQKADRTPEEWKAILDALRGESQRPGNTEIARRQSCPRVSRIKMG